MIRLLLLTLPMLLQHAPDQAVVRSATVNFEMVHRAKGNEERARPLGEGRIEVVARVCFHEPDEVVVELRRMKVQNTQSEESGEFDTDEETFWPIRWWRLRQLRRAMRAPLHYVIDEGGQVHLLDEDLAERFGDWPNVFRFVRLELGEVLFCREFVARGRELEQGMLFEGPIFPEPSSPTAEFEVQEVGDEQIAIAYSADLVRDELEGHFSGYMELDRKNPLVYQHIGMDIYTAPAHDGGKIVTILRRDISSSRERIDAPHQDVVAFLADPTQVAGTSSAD